MITIRSLTAADIEAVVDSSRPDDWLGSRDEVVRDAATADGGGSICLDGQPVAFITGRVHPHLSRVCYASSVFTDVARGHGIGMVRAAREILHLERCRMGVEMIYTFCRCDKAEHQKWMRVLGFKHQPEGDHNNYGHKWLCFTF